MNTLVSYSHHPRPNGVRSNHVSLRSTWLMMFITLLALLVALLFTDTAAAQQPSTPQSVDAKRDTNQTAASLPNWEQLTPQQREMMIAVIRERWNSNPQQRTKMLLHAQRWKQMTPDQRRDAQSGQKRWQNMNPKQREHARILFESAKNLPPEEREALRQQLKAMTPEQRRAWFKQQRQSGQFVPRQRTGTEPTR